MAEINLGISVRQLLVSVVAAVNRGGLEGPSISLEDILANLETSDENFQRLIWHVFLLNMIIIYIYIYVCVYTIQSAYRSSKCVQHALILGVWFHVSSCWTYIFCI